MRLPVSRLFRPLNFFFAAAMRAQHQRMRYLHLLRMRKKLALARVPTGTTRDHFP